MDADINSVVAGAGSLAGGLLIVVATLKRMGFFSKKENEGSCPVPKCREDFTIGLTELKTEFRHVKETQGAMAHKIDKLIDGVAILAEEVRTKKKN